MSFNKTLEIFKMENPNWKIIKRIGTEGKDGLSYIIHHEINNVDGVVKLFKHKKSLNKIKTEYNILKKVSEAGLGPKLYQSDIENKRYIIMERLDLTLNQYLKEKKFSLNDLKLIIKLYEKLGKIGIGHNDTNITRNIMFKDNRFYLIDFGMAYEVKKKKNTVQKGINPNINLIVRLMHFVKDEIQKQYLRNYIDKYEEKYNVCVDLQNKAKKEREERLRLLLEKMKK
jgi:tRNA A-37 threonylcarbamoyl transferase component Bud32